MNILCKSLFLAFLASAVALAINTPPPSDAPPVLKGPPPPSDLPPLTPKQKALLDTLSAGRNYYWAADSLVSLLSKAQKDEFCKGGWGTKGIRASSGAACTQTLGASLAQAVCYHQNIASFQGSTCHGNAKTLLGERTAIDRPTQLNLIGGHLKKDGVKTVCQFMAKFISSFDVTGCETLVNEKVSKK